MFKFLSAFLFSTLLIPALNPAVYGQERGVTLAEAVELFAANNLELQESRHRAAEMAALARQASVYPNPSALVTHEPVWRGDASYNETYVNLSQRFEWPGLRSARVDAAAQLVEAANADLQADSLRLTFEVAEAYTEAVGAERRRDVLEEVSEIFRHADRANEAMLTSGEVSGYRTRRLRVERARYENRLAMASLAAADARRRLAILIQPQGDAAPFYPSDELRDVPTDLELEVVLQEARARRAELDRARANVEAAQSTLAVARRERLPEPTVTAGVKRQSDGFNGIFLGTSVPLPLFDRNRGAIAAGQNSMAAAESRLSLVEARIEQDVRRVHATYASLTTRVDLISEVLLGDADGLLHAARVGYEEGEMTLVELLDAAEAYSDARLSSLELRTELQIAYFDLLRTAGGVIDQHSFTSSN